MQKFKIKPGGFKEIKKQTLIRTAPILLIAGIVGITISNLNSGGKVSEGNVLPFVIIIITMAMGVGMYRGINRQRALFNSYTLTISSNLITRQQLNTPTISIYFNDIREIARHKNGSFTVKGKEAGDLIGIPSQIDHYAQLETRLQSIQQIIIKDKETLLQKYPFLTAFVAMGLMLCVYTVKNKIIVPLTGSALVALLIWSILKIRSSKNIDSKTKKGVRWALFVLAVIILVMVFKLTELEQILFNTFTSAGYWKW